jgi:hypothetical protein
MMQAVNYGGTALNLQLVITNMPSSDKIQALDSLMTVLSSPNLMDENSFSHPTKVCDHTHSGHLKWMFTITPSEFLKSQMW